MPDTRRKEHMSDLGQEIFVLRGELAAQVTEKLEYYTLWQEARSELSIINSILTGTGHSIRVDERGRYYLHSKDCDHYPLPPVMAQEDGDE